MLLDVEKKLLEQYFERAEMQCIGTLVHPFRLFYNNNSLSRYCFSLCGEKCIVSKTTIHLYLKSKNN